LLVAEIGSGSGQGGGAESGGQQQGGFFHGFAFR
jgi:hypothetical protein